MVFSQIFREISGVLRNKRFSRQNRKFSAKFLEKKKKGHDHSPFLTTQNVVLSSTEDRAFLRSCRLRDQGLDIRGQGFQKVSLRPMTSSRTPPLLSITLGGSFILSLFMLSIKQVSCEYPLLLPLV